MNSKIKGKNCICRLKAAKCELLQTHTLTYQFATASPNDYKWSRANNGGEREKKGRRRAPLRIKYDDGNRDPQSQKQRCAFRKRRRGANGRGGVNEKRAR